MRIISAVALAATLLAAGAAPAAAFDWNKVDQVLGRQGAVLPGGVHRYGFPRTDLHVTLKGVNLLPAFAPGGWLAFEPAGDEALLMGDLCLTEPEINPVMTKLLADGVKVMALHNHLLFEKPAIFFMHVSARGDPVKLAQEFHDALAAGSEVPMSLPAAAAKPAAAIDLNIGKVEQAMGRKGHVGGGVLHFGIPRGNTVEHDGRVLPPAMGVAIGINFEPTGGGKAAITGDFALLPSEVNPVLKALRENGIEVTALHTHMLDEEPRLFFLHFWANDDAVTLAKDLRAALEHVDVERP